ncbi:hypothetical protein C8R44DRAFT_883562 [Mycena epipterygia]|nr:hypothetical protein C8R44DRAFT_883562 [Mycena epipterygia]
MALAFGLARDFGKPKPWLSGQAKARETLGSASAAPGLCDEFAVRGFPYSSFSPASASQRSPLVSHAPVVATRAPHPSCSPTLGVLPLAPPPSFTITRRYMSGPAPGPVDVPTVALIVMPAFPLLFIPGVIFTPYPRLSIYLVAFPESTRRVSRIRIRPAHGPVSPLPPFRCSKFVLPLLVATAYYFSCAVPSGPFCLSVSTPHLIPPSCCFFGAPSSRAFPHLTVLGCEPASLPFSRLSAFPSPLPVTNGHSFLPSRFPCPAILLSASILLLHYLSSALRFEAPCQQYLHEEIDIAIHELVYDLSLHRLRPRSRLSISAPVRIALLTLPRASG